MIWMLLLSYSKNLFKFCVVTDICFVNANGDLVGNFPTMLTLKRITVSGSGCTMGFVWHDFIIPCYTLKIQQLPGLVLRSREWLLWIARRTVPAPNLHSGASVGRRDLKVQLQVLAPTAMMKQIWNGLQVRCWIGGSDIVHQIGSSNTVNSVVHQTHSSNTVSNVI